MKSKIHELKKNNSIAVIKKTVFLIILLAFTFSCNSNDDENSPDNNPVNQLPPATQVGANTFGCLLDGEVFVPSTGPTLLTVSTNLSMGSFIFPYKGINEIMKIIVF